MASRLCEHDVYSNLGTLWLVCILIMHRKCVLSILPRGLTLYLLCLLCFKRKQRYKHYHCKVSEKCVLSQYLMVMLIAMVNIFIAIIMHTGNVYFPWHLFVQCLGEQFLFWPKGEWLLRNWENTYWIAFK